VDIGVDTLGAIIATRIDNEAVVRVDISESQGLAAVSVEV
jgi:hypothetical protein